MFDFFVAFFFFYVLAVCERAQEMMWHVSHSKQRMFFFCTWFLLCLCVVVLLVQFVSVTICRVFFNEDRPSFSDKLCVQRVFGLTINSRRNWIWSVNTRKNWYMIEEKWHIYVYVACVQASCWSFFPQYISEWLMWILYLWLTLPDALQIFTS